MLTREHARADARSTPKAVPRCRVLVKLNCLANQCVSCFRVLLGALVPAPAILSATAATHRIISAAISTENCVNSHILLQFFCCFAGLFTPLESSRSHESVVALSSLPTFVGPGVALFSTSDSITNNLGVWLFGAKPLPPGCFHVIVAKPVPEHLDSLLHAHFLLSGRLDSLPPCSSSG